MPLDELAGYFSEFAGETGGRREPQLRALVTDGLRTVERLRKWAASVERELETSR